MDGARWPGHCRGSTPFRRGLHFFRPPGQPEGAFRQAYAGGIPPALTISLVFGLTQVQALVILFVVLPLVAAAVIVPALVWWLSRGPKPLLTSELLASGTPAEGTIRSIRSMGTILDARPMIRFRLDVTPDGGGEPFELEVVQSFPRSMLGVLRPGDIVRVRLSPDRSAGAIEWGYEPPQA